MECDEEDIVEITAEIKQMLFLDNEVDEDETMKSYMEPLLGNKMKPNTKAFELPDSYEVPKSLILPESFVVPETIEIPNSFALEDVIELAEAPKAFELPDSYEVPYSELSEPMDVPESFKLPKKIELSDSFAAQDAIYLANSSVVAEAPKAFELPDSFDVPESFYISDSLEVPELYLLPETIDCNICEKRFTQPYTLKKHPLNHNKSEKIRISCKQCQYTCTCLHYLNQHIQEMHGLCELEKCPKCDFYCMDKFSLSVHKKQHIGKKLLKCTECPYEAERENRMTAHMLIHTDTKPYKCDKCIKKFRSMQGRKVHKNKYHVSECVPSLLQKKSLKCAHCTEQFKWKSNLIKHMATHGVDFSKLQALTMEEDMIDSVVQNAVMSVKDDN